MKTMKRTLSLTRFVPGGSNGLPIALVTLLAVGCGGQESESADAVTDQGDMEPRIAMAATADDQMPVRMF